MGLATGYRRHDPTGEGWFTTCPARVFPIETDEMEPGATADQRGQFGSAEGPHSAVASQPHSLIRGEVGDRVGEVPILAWGQK